jgi:hypothetical protein
VKKRDITREKVTNRIENLKLMIVGAKRRSRFIGEDLSPFFKTHGDDASLLTSERNMTML